MKNPNPHKMCLWALDILIFFQGQYHSAFSRLLLLNSRHRRWSLDLLRNTFNGEFPQVCKSCNIPFVSLDDTPPGLIAAEVEEKKPRVIMGTISTVAREDFLSRLRKLPIQTVCLDEAQVPLEAKISLCNWPLLGGAF